ncbi:MAG: PIN domain-containing protein [Chloroflexi bacterium]|nr:PIN domain-containing protein [Chloroflexota bacterium]
MMYADASVIASAYLGDEPGHARWRARILEGTEPVVSTELVLAEVASALAAAAQAGRIQLRPTLRRFEADCGPGGPIQLLAFLADPVLRRAVGIVEDHPLRVIDAIHLAVALEQVVPLAAGEPIAFLTAGRRQAAAARSLGFRDPDDPTFQAAMAVITDVEEGVFLRADTATP